MKTHTHVKNMEWGRKARKEEDRLRGINNADRRADITEQLDEADVPFDDGDDGPEALYWNTPEFRDAYQT